MNLLPLGSSWLGARRLRPAVARAEEHARRDRLAPGQHLTCQAPCRWNPATRDTAGHPAASPAWPLAACPAKGASAAGKEAVGRFPPLALHPCFGVQRNASFFAFFPPILSSQAQTLLLVVVGIYGPVYLISGEPILISEAAREGLHWTAR